ncbi:MAG: hypothetical protein AAB401_25070 [Acidobacteriota bacterium]
MEFQLNFPIRRHFRTSETGIVIPCTLWSGNLVTDSHAKVDSGSEYCLFQREVAEELQIEVENGFPVGLNTLTGSLTCYAHTVLLGTFGIQFESVVLFHPGRNTSRNILGRIGWLNNLHLGLTMDDDMIYLGPAFP